MYLYYFTLSFVVLIPKVLARILPDIYWDTRNPLFDSMDSFGGDTTMSVRIRDRINIHCPLYNPLSVPDQPEYSKIYMVSAHGYKTCELHKAHLVLECQTPFEQSYITMVFREYTPKPNALEFTPGETYYFISTSTGFREGIDNPKGGMCADYNMKLKVHVSPKRHSWQNNRINVKATLPTTTTSAPPAYGGTDVENFLQSLRSDGVQELSLLRNVAPHNSKLLTPLNAPVAPLNAPLSQRRTIFPRTPENSGQFGAGQLAQSDPNLHAEIVIYELRNDQRNTRMEEGRDYIIGYADSNGYHALSSAHYIRHSLSLLALSLMLTLSLRTL